MDYQTYLYFLRKYPQMFAGSIRSAAMGGAPGAGPGTPPGPAMQAPASLVNTQQGAPGLAGGQGTPSYAMPAPDAMSAFIQDPGSLPTPTPLQQRDIRRSQLMRFGLGMLAASGPRPGTGGGIGRVLGDVGKVGLSMPTQSQLEDQTTQENMAKLAWQQQQRQMAEQQRNTQALRLILTAAAPQGTESPQEVAANLTRLLPQVMAYGSPQLVSAISEVVKTLGAQGNNKITNPAGHPGINNERGTPWFGKKDQYIVQQDPQTGQLRQVWLHTAPDESSGEANLEFVRGTQIQSAYLKEAKDPLAQLGNVQIALHSLPEARAGNTAAVDALFEQFIRTFNAPGAVVRPGTMQIMEKLQSLNQQIEGKWGQWMQGHAALATSYINQMGGMLGMATKDLQDRLKEIRGRYVTQADNYKVPQFWIPTIPVIDTSDVLGNSGIPQNQGPPSLRQQLGQQYGRKKQGGN